MSSNTICLVTHCYCPPGLDIYAEHLRWQWATLVNYPATKAKIKWVVCCASREQDPATHEALDAGPPANPDLWRFVHVYPLEHLFRRAIGRNIVAKTETADAVIFTDVDYLWSGQSLDAIADLVSPDDLLCSPEYINISIDHATGQRIVDEARGKPVPPIPFETFAKRRQKVAIGGCQIVGGNTARRVGYCDNTKWTVPVSVESGFRSCKCDRAFRKLNNFTPRKLPLEGVYRLRHVSDGRDYDLAGEKIGRKAW